jgi:4-amino-4-deoxy-L-arabinose transferase-like glycosyltransferase
LIICTTGALALFVHSQRRLDGPGMVAPARQVTWRHAAGIYVALGLAMLAKGPVGFVLPAGVIGLYLVASERAAAAGRPRADGTWAGWARALALASWDEAMALPGAVLRGAGRMRLMSGLALALAVALPWYVWVWQRTDGAWIEGFFLHHNRDRMLKSLEGHSGPVWYYVPAVLLGFFPWSLCLAPALYFGWKSPATEEQASHRFLLVWLVGYLGVFSVAATKLPSYVLPCYPALALVVGWWMDRWADEATQFVRRSQRSAFIALAAVGLGLCVGLPITLGVFLPGEEWLGVVGLVPLVAGLLGWVELRRERLAGARWCFVGGAVLFCWLLFGFAAGPVSVRQNAPHLSALVRSWTGPTTAVATYHYSSPGLVFYTREREEAPAVQFFDDADQLAAFWAENLDATVITRSERLAELEPHLPAGVQVLAQERRFLRDDDVIVLGRPPMARADWPVRR